jgi:hypothetical protein
MSQIKWQLQLHFMNFDEGGKKIMHRANYGSQICSLPRTQDPDLHDRSARKWKEGRGEGEDSYRQAGKMN